MNKRLRKKLKVAEFAQTGIILEWCFIKDNNFFFDKIVDALDVIPTIDFAGFSDNDGGWLHIWHSKKYAKFTSSQRELIDNIVNEIMLRESLFVGNVIISQIQKL